MSPAAAADPRKFRRYNTRPSRQTDRKLRLVSRESASDKLPVFTKNHPKAMLNSATTRAIGRFKPGLPIALYSASIVHMDIAQQARLNAHRYKTIFSMRRNPYFRKRFAVCAATM